ncbi:MAG: BREX-1 system adenine-specific DNA-methyltransferase PglX [Clostridium sp.]|uniref:BREX-1 system adenine-specific DNA-methyltransferase PglX n=1 Tax=Clostridium sp. TaxID=1506 RepID=UPI00290382B7|nr:BREX-1 system adenine-specific DNA-methyltransferase PglX [Clostridium sp.]MDU1228905.1 BREX-1 system adenine-specific DNA-methyltransferase PglX [Clostridium sp.]MDU3088456.1 BREX-1 system adenine-specific DNA-methyltransferase PglX [Clostridium sp.]
MDKNKIKSFAVWARRKMIESVTEKAERIGITEDKIEEVEQVQGGFKLGEETFYLSSKHRDALIHQIDEKDFKEVMEEVAYTWFNRFMGLRYMEVNDYLPSGIRTLSSSVEGKVEPDVLSKVSDIIEELNLNGEDIYNLLDTGNTTDREKAYRIILVKQCNELGKIIPQMFEKISDYTELLLPDNLLEEGSVIRKMVEDIEESDWQDTGSGEDGVEIIGWMYQYYIAEEKDRVIQAKKRYKKNEIPFATQLFTPKWIVKYMVENSLGRLWLEHHPNEELQNEWKYYLEKADQEREVEEAQKIREEHAKLTPEHIKVLDPCMGSGHILVYAFDVFYEIYKTAGYSEREIPKLILQNNLYGLDIDDRATQLASFALIMKARHYNRRLFREIEREGLKLNLCSIQESNILENRHKEFLNNFKNGENINQLIDIFYNAKTYGSLIDVNKLNISIDDCEQLIRDIENYSEYTLLDLEVRENLLKIIPDLINQYRIMKNRFDVLITNPPYMGSNYMTDCLSDFIKSNYNDVKSDLFAAFIKYSLTKVKKNGHLGFISPFVWMFLSSYNSLRNTIIDKTNITSLIQLEYNAFPEACVPVCTFTLKNANSNLGGEYIKLSDFPGVDIQDEKVLEAIKNPNVIYRYTNYMDNYKKIPNNPIAYWMNNDFINLFTSKTKLKNFGQLKSGASTSGQNDKLFRLWFEVDSNKIEKKAKHYQEVEKKWLLMNKGGAYRRWYGNLEYVCNSSFCPKNETEFDRAITWSDINSHYFSARVHPQGVIANNVGKRVYINDDKNYNYILGFLNTVIAEEMLNLIIPTLHFDVGYVGNLPVIDTTEIEMKDINRIVEENILISKEEWDSFETSLDFKNNSLLKIKNSIKIRDEFNKYKELANNNFYKLKNNEERLNEKFINIYGLNDELKYNIEDKNITLRSVNEKNTIKELISYAVGCMFGRYSIDAEGLIYAGGEFSDKWAIDGDQCKVKSFIDISENDLGTIREYKSDENDNLIDEENELKEQAQREEVWTDASFRPDKDNIIPITEDEYFEDDIVSRLIEFIRTVYGEDNLEENLDYIADSIGRKTSESARQAIRRYFIKDFYKDHLKIYQKRPIYWMLDSGKNDGFKCLVYMHRYNDQTVAKVRTDYLHTLQRKYEAEINRQQLIVDSSESTTKDKTVAKKKIDRINKQIEECREYDEVVAYLANEKISIDLDDGVKVNYAKFQDVKVINSKNKEVKMNLLAKI